VGELFLDKVVAFITRAGAQGAELLLFEHPYAGIQLPAGTVEAGEPLAHAVLREAWEETGLTGLELRRSIGAQAVTLPDHRFTLGRAQVYARPDAASFGWAELPRGVVVRCLRQEGDFEQIRYREWDRQPNSRYVTYEITGWAPRALLTDGLHRHFFHLSHHGQTPAQWTVATDSHRFRLFWARLDALPALEPLQAGWLGYVQKELGYDLAADVHR